MRGPTIYYIRHGETDWNAQGRVQGSRDIPLNALGHRQANQAGRILADLLARDHGAPPRLGFVSSPLGRARLTMELVRGALQLPPEHYAIDHRLREIGYGSWEGATHGEMQQLDPDHFERRQLDKWTVPPPGGESYAEVQARMAHWYRELTADTVTVAHGGTARALMVALGIAHPEKAVDLTIEQGVVYVFAEGGLTTHR
jgi:probable phosphoglycerate mutase